MTDSPASLVPAGADAASLPESARHEFSTADPERAAEVLQRSYQVSGGVWIAGDTDGFHFAQEAFSSPGFALTRFQCRFTIGYQGPLDGLLCVEQIHAGLLAIESGEGELRASAGDICLIPPDERWRATSERIDMAPLMLDRAAVTSYAAATCGIDPDTLVFTGLQPVSVAAARRWNSTVAHVRDELLTAPELTASSRLLQAQARHTLTAGLLATFPNTAMHALIQQPPPAAAIGHIEPAAVRRAVEFIETNAHRPITVAEIAAAAHLSPRGLQHAFRTHCDRTPMQQLKHARLAHAHHELQTADPTRGETVAAIAARWGYAHPSRFAADYRHRYGRSPRHALHH